MTSFGNPSPLESRQDGRLFDPPKGNCMEHHIPRIDPHTVRLCVCVCVCVLCVYACVCVCVCVCARARA